MGGGFGNQQIETFHWFRINPLMTSFMIFPIYIDEGKFCQKILLVFLSEHLSVQDEGHRFHESISSELSSLACYVSF